MAKDKEKTLNPAAAHLKSQKKSALKKGKAQLATQRTEKLARRNPERLQRQIDDLKATEAAQGGKLRPRDQQALEQLERDVKAIRKAREVNGSNGGDDRRGGHGGRGCFESRGRGGHGEGRGRGGGMLGKRRREDHDDGHESEETDEEVRKIPMPRDTPPPIPSRPRKPRAGNPNDVPLGENARAAPHALPAKPVVAQTTYSSAPQIRNLQKEATSKFVPAAVAARLKQRAAFSGKATGGGDAEGRLLEPEEVDALERDGYLAARGAANEAAKEEAYTNMAQSGGMAAGGGSLEEEEAAFERELRAAEREMQDEIAEGSGDETQQANMRRGDLADAARNDAKEAAVAMADEGEHILKAEAATLNAPRKEQEKTNLLLRYQEVEDVEDDEW